MMSIGQVNVNGAYVLDLGRALDLCQHSQQISSASYIYMLSQLHITKIHQTSLTEL